MRRPILPAVFSLVGNTPLVPITKANPFHPRVKAFAKAEWTNPGGSVKDRAAKAMLEEGLRRGAIPGRTILEATSGNTGISLATFGAALGVPVELVCPESVSPERVEIMRALGAHIILTDASEGQDGAIRRARELAGSMPEKYFYTDQYSNRKNWEAHYRTTGPEIWRQTRGRVTHFVAGLGTTGTIMGTGRFLKRKRKGIRVVGLEPEEPLHGIEGLKHMETSLVPSIYDPGALDDVLFVSTKAAYEAARTLIRDEGLFVGQSSGANLAGALRVAATLDRGVVVTVFPDDGSKYLSTALFRDR
ncbi:MAG: PLP-dependent cysteine synthase family protein [Methanobacteriota archaeon]